MTISDLVVLAPGFLGFDQFGGFPYFAQVVGVAIRMALKTEGLADVAVAPMTTVPVGSLAVRQGAFVDSLQRVVEHFSQGNSAMLPRVHVVGHSTGGVDAELFTYRHPISSERWSASEIRLRSLIRSIISIASPFRGTALAHSPFARFLAHMPAGGLDGARQFGEAMAALPPLVRQDVAMGELLGGLAYDRRPLSQFVLSLLRDRRLIADSAARIHGTTRRHRQTRSVP